MARPPSATKELQDYLADGRVVGREDLVRAGFSRATVSRFLSGPMATRVHSRGWALAATWRGGTLGAVAARFGGEPDHRKGVLCLSAAAVLHGLTDMATDQLDRWEVSVAPEASHRSGDLPVRLLKLDASRHAECDVEWHAVEGCGIHVTTRARTVCDLFAPWRGAVAEGMPVEALGRLMREDAAAARLAVKRAGQLGWGKEIAEAYEAMRAVRRFADAEPEPDGGNDMGGMSL
jgi:hypothetical protein